MKKIILVTIIILALIINAGCKIVITPHTYTETAETTTESEEPSTTKKSSQSKKSSADRVSSTADSEESDEDGDETSTKRPPQSERSTKAGDKTTERKTAAAGKTTTADKTTTARTRAPSSTEKETAGRTEKTTTEKQRESKPDPSGGDGPDPTNDRPSEDPNGNDNPSGDRPTRQGETRPDPSGGDKPEPSGGDKPDPSSETGGSERVTRRAGEELEMYELGADRVPSLTGIVGSRTRPSFGTSSGNYQGVPCKIYDFEYESNSVQQDMEQYVNTLRFDYGYMLLTDMDLTEKSGFVSIAIESAEPGMLIILDIEWDQRGYKLTFYIVEGTLTLNG